jgi:hypothetical protein
MKSSGLSFEEAQVLLRGTRWRGLSEVAHKIILG